MQDKDGAVSEFAETLRAAAAAVGQGGVALEVGRDSGTSEVDADREARVAELRRQYLAGSYSVDASEIAARVVNEHLT